MLDILTRNYNYRNKSARLYELAGSICPEGRTAWPTSPRYSPCAYGEDMDFYAMKGAVEAFSRTSGL